MTCQYCDYLQKEIVKAQISGDKEREKMKRLLLANHRKHTCAETQRREREARR